MRSMSETPLLQLDRVECRIGERAITGSLSMRVRQGMLACLLGPSGCGKTTVLRAIAGFQPITSGEIRLRGEIVSSAGFTLPPERRHIGVVFQDYALFPHLDVLGNITFGLHGLGRTARRKVCAQMLEVVGLESYARRYPHELSGGQQQRVAVARALAAKPDLILLDEPFSSLDVELRERLGRDVAEILKHEGTTAILVTHDQLEAFAMGEQIGVLYEGELLQWDTPYNLYHDPANRFIADFIGQGRFIDAILATPDTLETPLGEIQADRAFLWSPGTALEVLLRPDDVVADRDSRLKGLVVSKAFKGAETLYTLRLEPGIEVLALFPSHMDYVIGDTVSVRIAADHAVAFERGCDPVPRPAPGYPLSDAG
jgi:iron(III) transport system ATP-binding protein